MKDLNIIIRVLVGFIGFIMMCNEQLYPEPQNWYINYIGVVIFLSACITKKNIKNLLK